jgi:signal transduction histidine kinase
MPLERRLILVSLLVALPVAGLAAQAMAWVRASDLTVALERVVTSQVNTAMREHCESDPTWFLTGALLGRPRPTDPKVGPDDIPARPRFDETPYQLFAYDDEFVPSSPVGVHFPNDFKIRMRAGADWEAAQYDAPDGVGSEFAMKTGWENGPCAILLARMAPPAYARLHWWAWFVGVELVFAAVFIAIATPTVRRIRAVSRAALQASRSDWTIVVPSDGHDELTAIGATINEASADMRRRIKDVADRDDVHRRFLVRTAEEIGQPLTALATDMAAGRADAASATRQAHDLALELGNLLAAARLRMHLGPTANEAVDLVTVAKKAIAAQAVMAAANDVRIESALPATPVTVQADPTLVEQALLNLIDNAVRYNRRGGTVRVSLTHEAGSGALRVTDNGPGVSDDKLAEMTAIRRFRGDEGRSDRVRQRGLGLALVWEIVDRSNFALTLRHAPGGGFEAELGFREN